MSTFAIGVVSFPFMLVLMALRIPIGVAMILVGGGGYIVINGLAPLLHYLKTSPYFLFNSYSLSVIPLFILMGQFASHAGLSRALFQAANAWIGHFRGGLAMAGIGGCAGFGAICGSSLATAATMAKVALPEMQRFGYSGALSTGSLAAGGTLGILIPPSVILVIYAILTEQSIAKMFIAALVPAAIAVAGFMIAIAVYVGANPEEGPAADRSSMGVRLRSLVDIWPVALIFGVVVGGIYGGFFTPTEGAAVGAFATGLLAVARGALGWRDLMTCLRATAETTAMIFLVLLGAEIYNAFLAHTRMPMDAAAMIVEMSLSPYFVIWVIVMLYLVLGCLMDSMSMILLTVPIFFPIVTSLDLGLTGEESAIWFGIIALMVVELGLITPPVGLNVFVINQLAPGVTLLDSFRGVVPFFMVGLVRVMLHVFFPGLTLWLVRLLW
ncbi:MAG: TRAP transporter large permease [Rhodospirillales bacterium]|nr:TRAP transporter large permease [Rhodospirillales bacterium]